MTFTRYCITLIPTVPGGAGYCLSTAINEDCSIADSESAATGPKKNLDCCFSPRFPCLCWWAVAIGLNGPTVSILSIYECHWWVLLKNHSFVDFEVGTSPWGPCTQGRFNDLEGASRQDACRPCECLGAEVDFGWTGLGGIGVNDVAFVRECTRVYWIKVSWCLSMSPIR